MAAAYHTCMQCTRGEKNKCALYTVYATTSVSIDLRADNLIAYTETLLAFDVHTRYIPGAAAPDSVDENRCGLCGLANFQSVKKPIDDSLVLLRHFLNAMMVARSMSRC